MPQTLLAPSTTASGHSPVRVFFLSHSAGIYGAQRQLLDLVEGTRMLGVVPIVGLPEDGPLIDALARVGVATLRIADVSWRGEGFRFARKCLQTRAALPAFVRALERLNVDVVHSNTERSALGAFAAHRLGLPHVWHLHSSQRGWLEGRSAWIRSIVGRSFSATTSRVVAPSRHLAEEVRPYVPSPGIQVVPNGLLRPGERRPLAPWRAGRELRLLTVGRAKRWETAIDVLARIVASGREASLTFVGGEPRAIERVRALAVERRLAGRVRFVGPVEDPRPFYESAGVLLHPSAHQSFGRVLVEAMAVGLPVVAHRVGGIPEVVRDGETGWLTDVGDAEAMASAVLEIVGRSHETERRRTAAHQDVWGRFTVQPFAAAFAEIYHSCLQGATFG